LESHCDLLDARNEATLRDRLAQALDGSVQAQRVRDALVLLQDARIRGETVKAIREAYVNMHGGFVLDLPPWLEEVEQQLAELKRKEHPEQTAEARVSLL